MNPKPARAALAFVGIAAWAKDAASSGRVGPRLGEELSLITQREDHRDALQIAAFRQMVCQGKRENSPCQMSIRQQSQLGNWAILPNASIGLGTSHPILGRLRRQPGSWIDLDGKWGRSG